MFFMQNLLDAATLIARFAAQIDPRWSILQTVISAIGHSLNIYISVGMG